MIYEALVHKTNRAFVVAKPQGWTWSPSEKAAPFELILTTNLQSASTDFIVKMTTSWGTLTVNASQIDSGLITPEV